MERRPEKINRFIVNKLPRVSVGLPTYNRPGLLRLVLKNFQQQTFSDFELIISDNASPDPEVRLLCEEFARSDSRFRYVRQPVNQGAEVNFWYVYDQATAPLFLWASDDDLWPLDFLEKGVAALDQNSNISAWFCQVVNIGIRGDVLRTYPSFARFQSTGAKSVDLARFLWEPEILGKANLIYSIFRHAALQAAIGPFRGRPSSWGSDMNLVYGFLCRSNILVDDQVVLQKRVPVDALNEIGHPRSLIYPWDVRRNYFDNYRRAAFGSGYVFFTTAVLTARFLYDSWFHGLWTKNIRGWLHRCRVRFFSF